MLGAEAEVVRQPLRLPRYADQGSVRREIVVVKYGGMIYRMLQKGYSMPKGGSESPVVLSKEGGSSG